MTLNPFAIVGQLVAAILPDPVEAWLRGLVDQVEKLLQGETARVIGYGAGVIIYLVAKAVGSIPDLPFDQAVLQAGAAAALLVTVIETIRKYVFSPATVAAIVATPPTAAGPIVAATEAGVPAATVAEALVTAPDPAVDAPAVLERLDAITAEPGEGPVDEAQKGVESPSDGEEVEPADDLSEPQA